jgi:hypothetical protein
VFPDFFQDGEGGLILFSILFIMVIFNMEAEEKPLGISIFLSMAIIYFTFEYWQGVLAWLWDVCVECVGLDWEYLIFPVVFLSALINLIINLIKKKLKF